MHDDLMSRVWREVRGGVPPEGLPGDPLDALAALVPDQPVELPGGLVLGGCAELPPDPWRRMFVGGATELAALAWSLEAARLLPIGRARDDGWLAVDLEPDDAGRHRVYVIDAGGTTAKAIFKALPDFLEWLAKPGRLPRAAADAWAKRPASVESALEPLRALHPALLVAAYRARKLQPGPQAVEPTLEPGEPGWRRVALVWSLAHFWLTKDAALPPGVAEREIAPVHKLLLGHLSDLADAIAAGEVPALVADLALDDDAELAQGALDWMLAFDASREKPAKPADPAVSERTKGLISLLQATVEELTRQGAIEVPARAKDRLVEELLETIGKASNANQIVPLLIESLLESSFVEEVYADDSKLQRLLEATLGMRK
jgi:hypothetical protein